MPAKRITLALVNVALLALNAPWASALELQVVDGAGGRALAGASVAWRVGDGKSITLSSDAAGKVKIPIERKADGTVRVSASKQGFAPMTMWWGANEVPGQFDLSLPQAQTIGGQVRDEAGQPVAGASITLNLPQRLAGPRVAVEEFAVKSETDGRWRCELVPKDAAYVFAEVSHPKFDSPAGDVGLEALRTGKAEFKLYAVATVHGRVLDETGRGVPGAELMLGQERDIWPGSSLLEARTDSEGAFEFQRARLEKRLLGTHARGFAPAMQSVEIKRDATPLEIRLKPGVPLRVRVVDRLGRPLAGVAAKVDEWPAGSANGQAYPPGRWAYPGWEWETDAQGRLIWSNAPPDLLRWSFTKGGYMTRSRHALKATPDEQVVTLGLPFRLSGSVADAASGQPVNEFVITSRYAQIDAFNAVARTNFSRWYEHNRKPFSAGQFSLYYTSPMLSGSRAMHDWQFRVEADGYEPSVSRIVRDEERGSRLDFRLAPRPLPELPVPAPTGARRVTAGLAVQPHTVRPGDTLTLFVRARVAAGHHVYGLEDSGCRNLPTSLEASLRTVLTPDGPWRGPEPKLHDDGSRTLAGEALFKRRFLVESAARAKTHQLPVTVSFQVCNDAVCWPPEIISLETDFEVVTSPE